MDVRKFRGAGVLMLCLLLTAAGIWNFRQGSLEVAGGISAGPVNEVDTAEAKVGLIFQVTGNGEETENVLKILRENGKKATFFVTESWGESWPELVTKTYRKGRAGTFKPGGQTMGSPSGREVRSLLEQAGERLRNLTGRELTLFQEREKRYGTGLLQAVQGAGLQPVGWSVDSEDWKDYGSDAIFKTVTESERLRPEPCFFSTPGQKIWLPPWKNCFRSLEPWDMKRCLSGIFFNLLCEISRKRSLLTL